MKITKFGNWTVSPEVITWQQEQGGMDYEISIDSLTKRVQNKDFFDWLVHVPMKTWMTREDTYALNSAFLYVLAEHNIQLTNNMFLTNALQQQAEILKDKPIAIEEIIANIREPRY